MKVGCKVMQCDKVLLIILCMWCAMWLAKVTIGAIAWRVNHNFMQHALPVIIRFEYLLFQVGEPPLDCTAEKLDRD
eukprot:2419663-Amphidinium_carterae.1